MAECHPVGFQWVMEAKARGATLIHVDPRFTRTSALADLHVPLRAGTDIEGDPDSPVSRGRLCPKGAATFQLVTGSHRVYSVLYRKPRGTDWEEIPLDQAMDMVAERVKKARDENWKDTDPDGNPLNHTVSMAHLGGATLDNEENYLIKKLFTALGVIQVENQARI